MNRNGLSFPVQARQTPGSLRTLQQSRLTEEGFGSIACVALLAIGSEGLVTNAKNVDEVLVLDGCPMLCAKKIADAQGVPVAQHLVMTDLGITKGPSKSYTDEDVEKVVAASWRGEGREKVATKPGKKGGDKDTGCGCGGGCGCSGSG